MSATIRAAIARLTDGRSLSEPEAEEAMDAIMSGEATPSQIAAFAVALRMKGETPEEVAGCARSMRRHAVRVSAPAGRVVVDTCGTGGDRLHSINVSTGAAFVAAGAGLVVAKHGNRSVSSKAGSADVLEALGVAVDLPPAGVERCLAEAGLAFLFAPVFHPAMRHAAGPRREIEIRTIFNILGPLTNPAGATIQLVGVYSSHLVELVGRALARLGSARVLVVHGHDGLDELSLSGPNRALWVEDGGVRPLVIDPSELGLTVRPVSAVRGDGPATNAEVLRRVLRGEERGACRDIVLLNGAAALWVAGKAGSMQEGLAMAAGVVDSGEAASALDRLVRVSQAKRLSSEGAA